MNLNDWGNDDGIRKLSWMKKGKEGKRVLRRCDGYEIKFQGRGIKYQKILIVDIVWGTDDRGFGLKYLYLLPYSLL